MSDAEQLAHLLGGAKRNGRGWLARCPCHDDGTASLSLHDGDRRLLVRCFGDCDVKDVLRELRRRGWLDDSRQRYYRSPRRAAPASKPAEPDRSTELAREIWRQAVPRDTLMDRYFEHRKLKYYDDLCGRVLRFHPRCPFGRDELSIMIYRPAVIAAFRAFNDDDESMPPRAIHRIALNPDGTKIGKMMLGSVAGCAVKLDLYDDNFSRRADVTDINRLGICEGIETGMAVRMVGWKPVWALGSAGAIKTFPPPHSGIRSLTIFGDHDANGIGEAAAHECGERWAAAGIEVTSRIPLKVGADWLEVLTNAD